MYEKWNQPIADIKTFVKRLLSAIGLALIVVVIGILVGMIGYIWLENMPSLEAFVNAAMVLSDMGQISPLKTTGGKIFAAFYALFSGLAFISIVSMILAPIMHRFLHQFHSDSEKHDLFRHKTMESEKQKIIHKDKVPF